ncbi:MAG: hypothetical protein J6B77_05170 [Clostridia bacterium]|nr:hypothetical protein [Clostridia bacterium]
MKKATLLTFLFAVLMIALLVSCNTIPDPLPDETSSEITTAEITTEPDVTTEEAVTLDLDWVNDTTPAPYRYIEALPEEKWYFDWVHVESIYKGIRNDTPIDEKVQIKTPLRYECKDGDVVYRFEFFEEYHPKWSFFQYRLTITNLGDEKITLWQNLFLDEVIIAESQVQNLLPDPVLSYTYLSANDRNKVFGVGNETLRYELVPGEFVVRERVFPLYPQTFIASKSAHLRFSFQYRNEDALLMKHQHFYIPVEIVRSEPSDS